jgi:hypothetical protein
VAKNDRGFADKIWSYRYDGASEPGAMPSHCVVPSESANRSYGADRTQFLGDKVIVIQKRRACDLHEERRCADRLPVNNTQDSRPVFRINKDVFVYANGNAKEQKYVLLPPLARHTAPHSSRYSAQIVFLYVLGWYCLGPKKSHSGILRYLSPLSAPTISLYVTAIRYSSMADPERMNQYLML